MVTHPGKVEFNIVLRYILTFVFVQIDAVKRTQLKK